MHVLGALSVAGAAGLALGVQDAAVNCSKSAKTSWETCVCDITQRGTSKPVDSPCFPRSHLGRGGEGRCAAVPRLHGVPELAEHRRDPPRRKGVPRQYLSYGGPLAPARRLHGQRRGLREQHARGRAADDA